MPSICSTESITRWRKPISANSWPSFTNSPHRGDAILCLARARLEQSNYTGAIELLQKASPAAGKLAADYLFWIAKARFSAGDYTNAAEGFAAVAKEAKDFPDFSSRLEAAYDEAEAHARTRDWPGVVRLLQQANGPFRQAAAADAKNQYATMGWLLLGEALFQEGNCADGEKLIGGLDTNGLRPDFLWQRLYLLCRLQLAGKKSEAALDNSTNLLVLAVGPRQQAASFFLQGEILEKLDRPADALRVYTNNLVDSQPPEVQRQALARIVHLTVALDPPAQAMQALEALIAQRPQAPALDLARVSLGELDLKGQCQPAQSGGGDQCPGGSGHRHQRTNALGAALAKFNIVITNFTNSALLPKAHLDRGWCYWLSTNIAGRQSGFRGRRRVICRFARPGGGPVQVGRRAVYPAGLRRAARNYRLVLTQNGPKSPTRFSIWRSINWPKRTSRSATTEGADAAVEKILRWYPVSYHDLGDRGQLLMGEDWNRKTNYAEARAVFTSLLEHAPHSPLAPASAIRHRPDLRPGGQLERGHRPLQAMDDRPPRRPTSCRRSSSIWRWRAAKRA